MFRSEQQLPPPEKRVLVFDAKFNNWIIGRLRHFGSEINWVLDPQRYNGLDNNRFTHWQFLPENPNGHDQVQN